MNYSKYNDLTERDCAILKATIEDYIDNYHPIGSQFLKRRHRFPFSPATIRNSLAKLESLGLLTHVHTSSGRIPTDAGYRFYVDALIEDTSLPSNVYNDVINELTKVANNVDELMQATAEMLAKLSHLFGVVVVSDVEQSILTDIELVPLASDRVMMVLAMTSGLIRSVVLNLEVSVDNDQLSLVTSILKERLIGLTLGEIQNTFEERLHGTDVYDHEIIQILLQHPHNHFSIEEERMIYTSPYNHLLSYPEFQEIEVLRKTLTALDNHYFVQFLSTHTGPGTEYTLIGEETEDALLKHCSVLTARFSIEEITGQLAVLGPTRLPYNQVKSILGNITEILANVY